MSDRDKPNYDPESSGDLNGYWEDSASFWHSVAEREALVDKVTNRYEWLRLFGRALAEDDQVIFDKLREKAASWDHSPTQRQMMLDLLRAASHLKTSR